MKQGMIHRARRGMSIVELLVAIGGMAVISGIALEIYDTTQKSAAKVIARQAGITAAAQLLDSVAAKLRGLQPGDNFDVSEPQGLEFRSDRITGLFFLPETKTGLRVGTIQPDGGRGYEWVTRDPLAMEGTEPLTERLGESDSDLRPQLGFRYARAARPDAVVEYVDRMNGDQWPAVIEITVKVPAPIKGEAPTVLRTAILPGHIPGRGGEGVK